MPISAMPLLGWTLEYRDQHIMLHLIVAKDMTSPTEIDMGRDHPRTATLAIKLTSADQLAKDLATLARSLRPESSSTGHPKPMN